MSKILLVVSEVGFTWEEIIRPFIVFDEAGYQIVIATPNGKIPKADPLSIQIRPFTSLLGLGISKNLSPATLWGKKLDSFLQKPIKISAVNPEDLTAIYVVGGHGALFDLNRNYDLQQLIKEFYNMEKPVGILCHASSTLAFIPNFLRDKSVTGFPTLWEYFILRFGLIHPKFLPLPIWTGKELNKHFPKRSLFIKIWEVLNPLFVIQDKNLISGVGPKTGGIIAQKMLTQILPRSIISL